VSLAARSSEDFTVQTEQVYSETIGIVDCSVETLLRYSSTGEISRQVRDALRKAVTIKQRIAELERHLAELTKRKQQIETGQERLRRNIQTVGSTSSLGKRYLAKLNEQEDRIEDLAERIEETQARLDETRAELSDYLEGLKIQ